MDDFTGLGHNGFEVSLGYLTGVADAQLLGASHLLLLAFKGLQKRDLTTREKAAGDLLSYVEGDNDISDDLLLICWAQTYAKLSLDESRKCRQLAHQIQAVFVKRLGKTYVKYLKDTVGIWLAGLYDTDKQVQRAAKTSIDEAFGHSTAKIDALWKAFVVQILEYPLYLVTKESLSTLSDDRFVSKEDAQSKWNRACLGGLMLVNRLLNETVDSNDQITTMFHDYFINETVLDFFSNDELKKSMYQTLKSLLVSRSRDAIIDKKLFKSVSKAAVKGLKIDKKKNPIVYGAIVIPMLDSMIALTNFDGSFWATTKKAKDRLEDVLKLGSLNSNAVYYDVIVKLLTVLPDDFINWNDNVVLYSGYLMDSLFKEKSIPFLERGWNVVIIWVLFVIQKIENQNEFIEYVTIQIVKFFDSSRPIKDPILKSFHQLPKVSNDEKDVILDINSCIMDCLPCGPLEIDGCGKIAYLESFLNAFVSLLVSTQSDILEVLIANSIDSLDDERDDSTVPELSLQIIKIFIQKDLIEFNETIQSFISTKLSSTISSEFIELPLEILKTYSKSAFCAQDTLHLVIDDIYNKLDSLNETKLLIQSLPQLKNVDIHKTKHLGGYLINSSSQTPEPSAVNESDILYSFLTLEILEKLYISDPWEKFVQNVNDHYNSDVVLQFVKSKESFLAKLLNEQNPHDQLLTKIESNLDNDDDLFAAYVKLLTQTVTFENSSLIIDRISKFDKQIMTKIITRCGSSLVQHFETVTPKIPYNVNDLRVYLFGETLEEQMNVQGILKKLALPILLSKLLSFSANLEMNLLTQLSFCSSLCHDLEILGSEIENKAQIEEYQSCIHRLLLTHFTQYSVNEVIFMINPYLMVDSSNQLYAYYMQKLLTRILETKMESCNFDSIDLKLFSSVQSQYSLIRASRHSLTHSSLNYMRNSYAVNLLDPKIKPQSALAIQSCIMLTALMDLDLDEEVSPSFNILPSQRMLILIKSLSSWLDDADAYEDSFIVNRVVLAKFVQVYCHGIYYVCDSSYPTDFINSIWQLGSRLIIEGFGIVSCTEKMNLSLLDSTLDLIKALYFYKDDMEQWDEILENSIDELINILFQMEAENAMGESICGKLGEVIELVVPLKNLHEKYDQLYDLVTKRDSLALKRTGCTLLARLIPEIQDKLVVEFTLSKKKLNEDGVSDITLPGALLEVMNEGLSDHLEYLPRDKVLKYLWSWYLLLAHFKNITHQMRQDYISQLGQDQMKSFLTFIFEELGDEKFSSLDAEYISNYSFDDYKLGFEEEVKKLLINLLYEISNYIGGTFMQTWFQSIRNKQMKAKVEQMYKKSISPLLINDILSTLNGKNSIEDTDFKIAINRKFNEIKCIFEIDEQVMEISITLPETYPLEPISVNGLNRIGVDEKKWKSWIMSAQYVINFQNGTVLDAIRHFKANVRANFENYEDCAICYSILNAVDHSTPNKRCSTCKNNFHSACLYRWFKSSGSSTCPLCRSKFQFKRHA